jgi:hypothetical protein
MHVGRFVRTGELLRTTHDNNGFTVTVNRYSKCTHSQSHPITFVTQTSIVQEGSTGMMPHRKEPNRT